MDEIVFLLAQFRGQISLEDIYSNTEIRILRELSKARVRLDKEEEKFLEIRRSLEE